MRVHPACTSAAFPLHRLLNQMVRVAGTPTGGVAALLRLLRNEFEHGPNPGSAAAVSGTVEVARHVHDQTCVRICPVTACEHVQDSLLAGGFKLEHGSGLV